MKRYILLKDIKRRRKFLRFEGKRLVLKSVVFNLDLNLQTRQKAFLRLNDFKKDSFKVRIKNRCMFTGRGPFTLRDFKVSRILFRQKSSFGKIAGVRKSS